MTTQALNKGYHLNIVVSCTGMLDISRQLYTEIIDDISGIS